MNCVWICCLGLKEMDRAVASKWFGDQTTKNMIYGRWGTKTDNLMFGIWGESV